MAVNPFPRVELIGLAYCLRPRACWALTAAAMFHPAWVLGDGFAGLAGLASGFDHKLTVAKAQADECWLFIPKGQAQNAAVEMNARFEFLGLENDAKGFDVGMKVHGLFLKI